MTHPGAFGRCLFWEKMAEQRGNVPLGYGNRCTMAQLTENRVAHPSQRADGSRLKTDPIHKLQHTKES